MRMDRVFTLAFLLSILSPLTHAALAESLHQGNFVSASGPADDDWYSNYLSVVARVPAGYLAVGGVEVREPTQGDLTVESTLYAYRFLADGSPTPDATFGSNGKLELSLPAGYAYSAPSLVAYASGGFVVAAEAWLSGDYYDQHIIVAKFNADGTPDTAFGDGADGSVLLTMPCTLWDTPSPARTAQAPTLLKMNDGRLVLAGSTNCDGGRQGFVTRLSASGVPETSWGDNGFLLLWPDTPGAVWLTAAAITGDGKLLVAGMANYERPWLARITLGTTPELDTAFGNDDGYQLLDPVANNGGVSAMALMSDGRIVLAAYRQTFDSDIIDYLPNTALLIRLLPSGALDTSFDSDGLLELNPGSAFDYSRVGGLLALDDGKLLVSGALNDRRAFALFDGAGALLATNAAVGADGYWQTPLTQYSRYADVLLDEAEDRVLAVGMARTASGVGTLVPNKVSDDSLILSWFDIPGLEAASMTAGAGGGGGGGGSLPPAILALLLLLGSWRRLRGAVLGIEYRGKSVMKNIVVVATVLLLAGCQIVVSSKGIRNISAQGALAEGKSIYIPVGPDGKYASYPAKTPMPAQGSGEAAANIVYDRTIGIQARAVKGVALETEEQAIASARAKGLDYVFYSRVNDWTDPNYLTCSDSLTDSASVDMTVYEVSTGKALRVDNLYNAGCPVRLLTIPFGTQSPEGRFGKIFSAWLGETLGARR